EVADATRDADLARARAVAGYVPRLGALVASETVGAAVLSGSEGQVDDPSLRDPLAAALGDAADLRTTPVEYPVEERTVAALTRPNPFFPASRPARDVAVVTGSVPSTDALDAAAAAVATTTTDLARAQQEWAFDALGTAGAEGRPVLTESAGLVSDEGTRTALSAALDEAAAAAGRPAPPESAGLVSDEGTRTALSAALDEATAALDAGVGGVPVARSVAARDAVLATTETVWADRLAPLLEQRRDAARATGV